MGSSREHLTSYEKNELRRHHLANSRLKRVDLQSWGAARLKRKVGLSTMKRIVNQPLDGSLNDQLKKKRKPQHAAIESDLLSQETISILSDNVLQAQANKLAGQDDITLSWIKRFKDRHDASLHKMH